VWDSHPLSVGATPLQVYIDGRATLDPEKVKDSLGKVSAKRAKAANEPKMRETMETSAKEELCRQIEQGKTVITGVTTSYLKIKDQSTPKPGNFTIVVNNGKVACFGSAEDCVSHTAGGIVISLQNGHVLPGLIGASQSLGMAEIQFEPETGDGLASNNADPLNPDNLVYAKYGVHLDGKSFARARIGGVTRAVSVPIPAGGLVGGVSVGIRTSGKKSILGGGIFKDEVALHFTIGLSSIGENAFFRRFTLKRLT
jgi:imidazolonepropionase-like amidohydrolase